MGRAEDEGEDLTIMEDDALAEAEAEEEGLTDEDDGLAEDEAFLEEEEAFTEEEELWWVVVGTTSST